jgi:hypothetical protein
LSVEVGDEYLLEQIASFTDCLSGLSAGDSAVLKGLCGNSVVEIRLAGKRGHLLGVHVVLGVGPGDWPNDVYKRFDIDPEATSWGIRIIYCCEVQEIDRWQSQLHAIRRAIQALAE